MKSTGIIRNIDSLGRVVLPKELRRVLAITPDTPLEIFTDNDTVILRKYKPAGSCAFCGVLSDDMLVYRGIPVCAACRKALKTL